jgi:cellulose synthase/poly-beta-1,6-N-acetylglucosamine synthase-like glycosyltransferase
VETEDTELSFRAHAEGLTLTLVPGAVVYVRQRASLLAMWRQHFAWGRADPYLWRRYRDVLPRPSLRNALIVWYCVVTRFPIVRTSAGRREWARLASYRFGRLVGSVEHRHLVLGWAVAAGAALTLDAAVGVTSVT